MAGLSATAIAQSLGTSVSTVRSQIGGVTRKLGVHSQREAISLAFRSGWSPGDQALKGIGTRRQAAQPVHGGDGGELTSPP